MHEAYIKKADESRAKLLKQDQEVQSLEAKIEEVKEEEQEEYAKVQELREVIRQTEFETGELTKRKTNLENELEQMVSWVAHRPSDDVEFMLLTALQYGSETVGCRSYL